MVLESGGGRRHPYVGMTLKDRNTKGGGENGRTGEV